MVEVESLIGVGAACILYTTSSTPDFTVDFPQLAHGLIPQPAAYLLVADYIPAHEPTPRCLLSRSPGARLNLSRNWRYPRPYLPLMEALVLHNARLECGRRVSLGLTLYTGIGGETSSASWVQACRMSCIARTCNTC